VEPQVRASDVNFLERLWAYLTIQDLLERVAKGELTSCESQEPQSETQVKRRKRQSNNFLSDDEDYDDYQNEYGSGSEPEEDTGTVEEIMDAVGDADIVICDNLERALYLSLKYEFVTPLTSLVVVKPDRAKEDGDFGEIEGPANIRFMSRGSRGLSADSKLLSFSLLASLLLCFVARPAERAI
jgi:hypothetical protein